MAYIKLEIEVYNSIIYKGIILRTLSAWGVSSFFVVSNKDFV